MLINIESKRTDLDIDVKIDLRILQLAEGSLPISNPAWLSAEGPVVSDPASAKGISVADCQLHIKC